MAPLAMRCPSVWEVMGFIPVVIVKLLFNALIKSVFEYCSSVWGNAPNDQLLRIFRVQKRCSRLQLDASFHDNSVQLFKKLQWMPIDDEIRMKKLCMFKIVNGEWAHYFTCYRTYHKNTHSYNTRASFRDHLAVPKCRCNEGLRTFHANATYLWNCLDDKFKTITHERNFKKLIVVL